MPKPLRLRSALAEVSDSIDDVFAYMYQRGWTDGLPVVPPTRERVEAMVRYAGRDPEEELGELMPKGGTATVERVAINAVMAGCLPEYFPVVLAAVEGACDPAYNLHGIQATTNPVTPMVVVNGPIRHKIGVNCGRNALGQGWRANATIGRALRLCLLNIGGGIPGEVDKSVLGWPGKYTFCFGENEEESPWEPLHVELGFERNVSTVTVGSAASYTNVTTAKIAAIRLTMEQWYQSVPDLIADSLAYRGNVNMRTGRGHPWIVLTPGDAKVFADLGYTKAKAKEYIYWHSGVPVESYVPAVPQFDQDWTVIDGKTYCTKRPEDLRVVVTGGPESYYAAVISSFPSSQVITRVVQEPRT